MSKELSPLNIGHSQKAVRQASSEIFTSFADFTAKYAPVAGTLSAACAAYGIGPVWITEKQYWCDGSTIAALNKNGNLARPKVLLLGDSLTAASLQSTSTSLVASDWCHRGPGIAAAYFSGGAVDIVGVVATGGYTIYQITHTLLEPLDLSDIDYVVAYAGMNGAGGSYPSTYEGYCAALDELWQMIEDKGAKPICVTIPPDTGVPVSTNNRVQRVNGYIRSQQDNGRAVADFDKVIRSTTTTPSSSVRSGAYVDTKHQSIKGAMYEAIELARIYQTLSPTPVLPASYHPTDPMGISLNPSLLGNNASGANGFSIAGGSITGTGPDSFSVYADANITVTCANAAASDVTRDYNEFACSIAFGASYTAGGSFRMYQDIQFTAFAAGTKRLGQITYSSAYPDVMFKCMTPGSNSSSLSTPTTGTIGDQFTDGSVTWLVIPYIGEGTIVQLFAEFEVSSLVGTWLPKFEIYSHDSGFSGNTRPAVLNNGVELVSGNNAYQSPGEYTNDLVNNWTYAPSGAKQMFSQQIVLRKATASNLYRLGPKLHILGSANGSLSLKVRGFDLRVVGQL